MVRPALLSAAALLIGACQPAADAPAEPPADSPATAPAPPAAPAEPAAAVLTEQGFGPLRIGMTRDEAIAALGPDDPAPGGPEPEFCDQLGLDRAPDGLLVMVEEGVVTRISLGQGATVRTDRGVGVGDPAEAVRTAYPDVVETPHEYGEPPAAYLTRWTRAGVQGIRFEIDQDRRVRMIHAGGPSIEYVEGCA